MASRAIITLTLLTLASLVGFAAEDTWIVREDGVATAKVGMTLSQLNTALGEKFVMPWRKDDQACFIAKSTKQAHVSFMIEDGHLSRVEIDGPGIATVEGIHVGDTELKARQAYGARLKIEADKYFEGGHYLTVRSSDGRYGIRFDAVRGKIKYFYAGRFQAIQYVEDCL